MSGQRMLAGLSVSLGVLFTLGCDDSDGLVFSEYGVKYAKYCEEIEVCGKKTPTQAERECRDELKDTADKLTRYGYSDGVCLDENISLFKCSTKKLSCSEMNVGGAKSKCPKEFQAYVACLEAAGIRTDTDDDEDLTDIID